VTKRRTTIKSPFLVVNSSEPCPRHGSIVIFHILIFRVRVGTFPKFGSSEKCGFRRVYRSSRRHASHIAAESPELFATF
jgi:hypothetical protein